MIILQATGQTCNQLWIYYNYLSKFKELDEKVTILAPDVTFESFPNLNSYHGVKFPLYSKLGVRLFGHKQYVKGLNFVVSNKISTLCLKWMSKVIPNMTYIKGGVGDVKHSSRVSNAEFIRKIFTPCSKITVLVSECFQKERTAKNVIIGVHIRRGDYQNYQGGQYFFSLEYYHGVMRKLQANIVADEVRFLVCSNENLSHYEFSECMWFKTEGGSALHDLYALSLCDYIIGPPSTFSGWASFYGNKPICFLSGDDDSLQLKDFNNILSIWDK
jgi:hypothetical protein